MADGDQTEVFSIEGHDWDVHSNFCRRCGMHERMAMDNGYHCRFSANLHAISHLRAQTIAAEKQAETQRKFAELIISIQAEMQDATTENTGEEPGEEAIEGLTIFYNEAGDAIYCFEEGPDTESEDGFGGDSWPSK